jgi:hypothetical protein
MLAYIVWELSRHGHRWFVPTPIMWIEYGAILVAMIAMVWLRRSRVSGAPHEAGLKGPRYTG